MNQKELGSIFLAILVIAIVVSAFQGITRFLIALVFAAIIILTNVFAKKVASYYLDSQIEFKLWEFQRFWFKPRDHFERPVPLGIILSLILGLITAGYFKFLAILEYDVKPSVHRGVRRFGLYSFSEMSEWHIGLIAFWGIIANLFVAVIAYLIGFPELAKLSVFLTAYSVIPVSNLDGTKLLFASKLLWAVSVAIVVIALGYVFWL